MTAPVAAAPSRPVSNVEQTFPKLTPEQIERVAAHSRTRRIESGEVLGAVGKVTPKFFVVSTGTIEAVQPAGSNGEMTVVARQLQSAGWPRARALIGGWRAWQAAGLPTQLKSEQTAG